jgi:hypothetical protein
MDKAILEDFPATEVEFGERFKTEEDCYLYLFDLRWKGGAKNKEKSFDSALLVISLFKRLMIGTFQGRFEKRYLQRYLDEFAFRFNRRKTKVVGKRFFRLAQQVAASTKLVNTALAAVSQRLAN